MAASATVICVTCLRCRHRGMVEADALARAGLPPTRRSRRCPACCVCEVCGAKTMRVERRPTDEAVAFVEG